MRRLALLALVLGAAALAQFPQHRLFEQPNLQRFVTAAAAAVGWSGPWFGFAMADSGVGGIPRGLTAACACQTVYGVTSDGDAGVLLSLTRNTQAYCTKTQGATPQAIAVGDMTLCDGGLPRIMYGAGVNAPLGLLVEAAATNLMLRSEEFTNPAWVHFTEGDGGDVTHTADTTLAPNGTLTADTVTWQATGPTDSSGIQQDSLTAVAYSGSVYSMGLAGDAGSFDIAIQTAGAYLCRDCTYNANAYTRCELPNVTSKTAGMFLMGNLSSICDGGTHVAQSVALWGAQVETGANVTSHIPTTSASATRNADVSHFDLGAFTLTAPWSIAATYTPPSVYPLNPRATGTLGNTPTSPSTFIDSYLASGNWTLSSSGFVGIYTTNKTGTSGATQRWTQYHEGSDGGSAGILNGCLDGVCAGGIVKVWTNQSMRYLIPGQYTATNGPINGVFSNYCLSWGLNPDGGVGTSANVCR